MRDQVSESIPASVIGFSMFLFSHEGIEMAMQPHLGPGIETMALWNELMRSKNAQD